MLVLFLWLTTTFMLCTGFHFRAGSHENKDVAEGFMIARGAAWVATLGLVSFMCAVKPETNVSVVPVLVALPIAMLWFGWSVWMFFLDKRVQRWDT